MLKKNQEVLIKLARDAIICYFSDQDPDTSGCIHLTQLRGCFVTLHKHNALRGCIGFPRPVMPLYEQIIAAARAAAFEDPRFEPLTKDELASILIEISILTRPELMKTINDKTITEQIKIGRDGLIIQYQGSSGLLLPQVATEYNWTAEQFLGALCEKAGLDKNTWKEKNCKIYKFKAEIFSE